MVHTIPNQLSTTITDEEPQRMSGVLRVGMFAVVEPTMQSACLIDECGVSILRTGFSHGSTSQRERRPGRLWREVHTFHAGSLAAACRIGTDRGVRPIGWFWPMPPPAFYLKTALYYVLARR